MGNEIQIFKHPQFGEIRAVEIDGEPWLAGKDVCEFFGDTNYRRSLARLDEDERVCHKWNTPGGPQSMTFVNEAGFYSLLFNMKPQKAKGVSQNDFLILERSQKLKSFKHWVTSEVLPSIRKHGAYLTPQVQSEILNNPDFLISLANKIKEEQEKNRALLEENNSLKPKALFADAVSVSDSEILIGALAKLLKQNGVNIGRNRLFEVLRREGYLIRDNTREKSLPTQKSMDMGLFRVKETTIHANGEVIISCTPYVTGKGQIYFMDRFLSGAIKA